MHTPSKPLSTLAHSLAQGATLSRYRTSNDAEEGMGETRRIVNIGDLQDLETRGQLETEPLSAGSYLSNALDAGDLAIATRGTILKASVIAGEHAGAIAGQNLAVLKPKRDLIAPLYLAGVLRSARLAGEFEKRSSRSTTIKLITLKQLGDLPIPCPPKQEQETLAKLFLEIEHLDKLASASITARRQLSEAAIGNLFGGT